jgi:hypothetical protein
LFGDPAGGDASFSLRDVRDGARRTGIIVRRVGLGN